MSNQTKLLELAKQGEPRAIAALMNQYFQPKGVTVKAALKNGCLQIMLKATQALPQQLLVAAVHKGIIQLKLVGIERVEIYGWHKEEEFPSWIEGFELAEPPDRYSPQPAIHPTVSNDEKLQEKINFLQTGLHKITEVTDGDGMHIAYENIQLKIRLSLVDAPERGQEPFGGKAEKRLNCLVSQQPVKLQVLQVDCYKRFVCEVFRGEDSVNLRMVREGHAAAYTRHLEDASDETFQRFSEAETQARLRRVGFWSQENPEMPWDYRYRIKAQSNSSQSNKPQPQLVVVSDRKTSDRLH